MKKKNRMVQLLLVMILICLLLLLSVCLAVYVADDSEESMTQMTEQTEIFSEEKVETDTAGSLTQVSETESAESIGAEIDNEENMTQVSEIKDAQQYFTASVITDEIYERINGCSYVENDNIAIEDLRYLQVLHVGFDGEEHVGELIVNKAIAEDILDIMYELYENKYPIERMVLVEAYGGDDELSMQSNNTSAFNYRTVEGSSSLSKHSYGMAIDINPFYNPCVRTYSDGSSKSFPEGSDSYADRSKDFSYKIDKNDLCFKLFTERGFQWGGDWNSLKDYQHFQKEISR